MSFDDKKMISLSAVNEYQTLFGSSEFNNSLTKEFYNFRKNDKANDEKIALIDIKTISVESESNVTNEIEKSVYEKVLIAKPTNDLKIEQKISPVLLSVFYSNSKLKIYNFTEILCQGNSILKCKIKGYNYYLKLTNQQLAYKPFEITAGTIFNHVYPEFSEALKISQEKFDEELKNAKKSMPKDQVKQFKEQDEIFYNAMFNEEVMDYINSC